MMNAAQEQIDATMQLLQQFPEAKNIVDDLANYSGNSYDLHRIVATHSQVSVPRNAYLEPFRLEGDEKNLHDLVIEHPVCILYDCAEKFNIPTNLSLDFMPSHIDADKKVWVQTCTFQDRDLLLDEDGNESWTLNYTSKKKTLAKFVELALETPALTNSSIPAFPTTLQNKIPEKLITPTKLPARVSRKKKSQHQNRSQGSKPKSKVCFVTHFDVQESKATEIYDAMSLLPPPLALGSPVDILSTHAIVPGVNKIQVFLKSTGARTGAHLENGNILSVNFNAGPGDCEWLCVEFKYVPWVRRILSENAPNINFSKHNWWPRLSKLIDAGVPIIRFVQPKDATVVIGIGCLHWVQSLGPTSNIAYNVAPMCSQQLEAIYATIPVIRGDKYQAIVRIKNHSFNIAENPRIADAGVEFLRGILYAMLVTLVQTNSSYNFLIKNGWQTARQADQMELAQRIKCRGSHWCQLCGTEMFIFYCFYFETKTKYTESDDEFYSDPRPPFTKTPVARLLCSDCCIATPTSKNTHRIVISEWVRYYNIVQKFMKNYGELIFPARNNPHEATLLQLDASDAQENDNPQQYPVVPQRKRKRYKFHHCDECKYSFETMKRLQKHKQVVHTDLRSVYCHVCDYETKNWRYFVLHTQKHGMMEDFPSKRPKDIANFRKKDAV